MQGQRQELNAVHRAQDRRDHSHRGGDGPGQGHAHNLRLRGHTQGAKRRRRAQVSPGGGHAAGTQQEEVH